MNSKISQTPLPDDALLARYRSAHGSVDCFVTEVPGAVSLEAFITAFYCSAVFKVERVILAVLASRPTNDAVVHRLARGEVDEFSAWTVEAREPEQILLRDMTGATRSWLRVTPAAGTTGLAFGSAVVARSDPAGRPIAPSKLFHYLGGFHVLYSRVLLAAAVRELRFRNG